MQRHLFLIVVSIWAYSIWGGHVASAQAQPANRAAGRSPAAPIIVVGTNTDADADTINAAIAASPVGAEIVIRGKCLINKTIRLLDDRSYRGESRTGTILEQADGANLVALLATAQFLDNKDYTGLPVAVRQLTLDGNKANNKQVKTDGLILRSWLSVVEDLHVADMSGSGLRITNLSAKGTKLKTTQVNGRISGNFIENSGRHGVFVEDTGNGEGGSVTDWILADNWIASSGVDGIHMDNAAGWFVERNHIYGVPQHAIYADNLFATSICDNYIEEFGETKQAGTWCGIRGTVNGEAASTIANNRIFNFSKKCNPQSDFRYLSLAVNYGTGVVTVTGNVIYGIGTARGRGTGQYFTAGDDLKLRVVSTGNFIDGVKTHRFASPTVTVSAGE